MSDLRAKSASAAVWSAIDKFGEQGIKFVLGLILARLLFPSDYGLIGMLAIFLALPEVLVNSGFGAALVQKKSADEVDFSSVFYFNILAGLVLYGILFLLAPYIAAFFEQPQLTELTRVLGLTIVINSFGLIQKVLLTKRLDFKMQTKISLSSILPSGLLGILLAYLGFGVWAIVFQAISRRLLTTVFFWLFHKWRPLLVISIKSLKSLFAFGSNLLIAGILHNIFDRIYLLIIGKFYQAETLGYYTRAHQFQSLPANSITSILERIAFPIYSSIQDDNKLLLSAYRKTVKMAAFFNFPVMFGIMVISEPMISLILTDKWLPSVVYLQLMCIAGLLVPFHTLSLSVIKAKGDSRNFLRLDIVKKIIATVILLIVFRWGVIAIIYSSIALSFLFFYMNFFYAGKKLSFSFGKQLLDLLPYFVISSIMAGTMYIATLYLPESDLIRLIVPILIGILVYFLMSKLLKVEAYNESMRIVREMVIKFKK